MHAMVVERQQSIDASPLQMDEVEQPRASANEIVLQVEALDRGGTLACAGIYMTEIPPLDYERHLFYERTLRSVTANTREDGYELLQLAARIPIHTQTETFALEQAKEALQRLKHDQIRGAGVIVL